MLVEKLPQLVTIFGPLCATDRKLIEEDDVRYLKRWINNSTPDDDTGDDDNEARKEKAPNNAPIPELGQPITLPAVIKQVYTYWVSKRKRLKKSLLRRYWTPTTTDSFDPTMVFRQRDKEKRRLRKKKQNDIEAYKKMRLLKLDFERVKVLCDLIINREKVNGTMVELTNGYFEERLSGLVDNTNRNGCGRRNNNQGRGLDRNMIDSVLNGVPRYFDDGPIVRVKGNKKRKRSQLGGWNVDSSRETSPVPYGSIGSSGGGPMMVAAAGNNNMSKNQTMTTNLAHGMKQHPPPHTLAADIPTDKKFIMAGHDFGLPAPNFLQPLATRESYNVSSDQNETVPSIPSYVNGRSTTHSHKFRHRPRLGRGGRIMIDRVPLPSSTSYVGGRPGRSDSPPTVVTYGTPMARSGYDVDTLGADGPNYNIGMSPPAGRRSLEGVGTNAKTAPKVPPAQQLSDLLPQPLDNQATVALSRKIEEICALGLLEDYKSQSATTSTAHAISASVAAANKSGDGNATPLAAATAEEEAALGKNIHEVLVPIEDWMEAPEALNIYGSEKFVIGPL